MKGWIAVGVGVALAMGAGEGGATVGLGGAGGGAALLAPADCGPSGPAPCPSTSTPKVGNGPLALGATAVPFTLAGVDGKPVTVAAAAGMKPVVLAFWSMFCEPCRDELPMVAQVAKKYGDRGVTVVTVNLDGEKLGKAVSRYMELNDMQFVAGLDTKADGSFRVAGAYGVTGTPTLFLLGRDGTVGWSHAGRLSPEAFEAALKGVLTR